MVQFQDVIKGRPDVVQQAHISRAQSFLFEVAVRMQTTDKQFYVWSVEAFPYGWDGQFKNQIFFFTEGW